MKKIIALLLAAIMVLGLAACASKSEPADQTPAADTAADTAVTARKLLHTRIEVSAGKIIKLDINNAPIILMPTTTVTAVSTAIRVLYSPVFVPVAAAKVSSKVTAKMRL